MPVLLSNSDAHFGLLVLFLTMLALLWWRNGQSGRGLDNLPGPRPYFLGGFLNMLELRNPKTFLSVVRKWTSGNEPIVRLNIGTFTALCVKSPDYIQKIYGSMNLDHMARPGIVYNAFKLDSRFDGLLFSSGEKWKSQRKLIMSMLSYKSLSSYVHPLNETARRLLESLETQFGEADGDAEPASIHTLFYNSTVNAICKTVFGASLLESHLQRGYSFQEFVSKMHRYMEIVSLRLMRPWLQLQFPVSPLSAELQEVVTFFKAFVLEFVREHKNVLKGGVSGTGDSGHSIIRSFVEAGLGFDEIYDEVFTLLVAGTDTTGTTLHFLLFFLALHPDHQERCRREVDLLFENSDLHVITQKELRRLAFLEQCVCETLRIIPPAFVMMRELEAPVKLEEHLELPSGTIVGVFLPAIHMNPEIYPNPEKFQPERFSLENRKSRHQYSYLPFSGGPRGCVGTKLAMMQLLISSAHVLRHFTFSTSDKFEDINFLPSITITPEHPMKFVFKKRKF